MHTDDYYGNEDWYNHLVIAHVKMTTNAHHKEKRVACWQQPSKA